MTECICTPETRNTANCPIHPSLIETDKQILRHRLTMAIFRELHRAEERWPIWPQGNMSQFWALSIISEELGEAHKVMCDYANLHKPWSEIRTELQDELIQTAAMCLRMLENLPI